MSEFMKTILRKRYLDRMIDLKDTPDIKIITGIRRSGKSQLMQAYVEYLQNHFDNVNIIYIDYSWEEIHFESNPINRMVMQEDCGASYDINIEPDNIKVSDTVTLIWEIE